MAVTSRRAFLAALAAAFALAGSLIAAAPVEWEHGWKTSRIVATRYQNKLMGFTIGFSFPRDPAKGDRAELVDYIEKQGGVIFQGGGYPGAEMLAIFKDVRDRASADRKLKEILPGFERVLAGLR